MSNEIRGVSASGTLYARIMNRAGLWWNGSSFEAYSAGNYANYDVSMTEQGDSGVYVADFPSGITTGGTYEYFVHRQSGGSPAEADVVTGTGTVDWSGTTSIIASSDSMTGSDFLDYLIRHGFKRTDKDEELYECISDAIQELRRRFMFDEAEMETETTDQISVLGDFKLDIEDDFGLLLGVIIEDDDTGTPLNQLTKSQFDNKYSSINVESDKGYPGDFTIYKSQIYIGPIPDQITYNYRISYSSKGGAVTSATTAVPFTNLYRDMLADNVYARIYKVVEDYDKSGFFRQEFERKFLDVERRERNNSGEGTFTVMPVGM